MSEKLSLRVHAEILVLSGLAKAMSPTTLSEESQKRYFRDLARQAVEMVDAWLQVREPKLGVPVNSVREDDGQPE